MRKSGVIAIAALLASLNGAPAAAQTAHERAREPDAMAALEKMGASMRKLQNFAVRAEVTQEEVLTTGQKLQYAGNVDIRVRRPNGLRVDAVSERQARSVFYDGKAVTLYSPRLGYYGTFSAPPTIVETVRLAADQFDLELPLVDLFFWGTEPALVARVKSAFRVGTETISANRCAHYAVRQELVDWQIWIREGSEALPCKLVITSTDDPSMPQYTAVFNWTPQQMHSADVFAFNPSDKSRKIAFQAPATEAAATASKD